MRAAFARVTPISSAAKSAFSTHLLISYHCSSSLRTTGPTGSLVTRSDRTQYSSGSAVAARRIHVRVKDPAVRGSQVGRAVGQGRGGYVQVDGGGGAVIK